MARHVQVNKALLAQSRGRVAITQPIITFTWGGAFEGWARNWVNRNFWRVRELFGSEEDAVQECALIFVRCCNSYEGKIDNPAWMMALFKSAVIRDWNTFAQRDGRLRSLPIPDETTEIDHNHGVFAAKLSGVTAELKQVLHAVATSPADFLDLMFRDADQALSSDASIAEKSRVMLNRRIKRLLGISKADSDIVSELRELLTD